jgi:hypothetical protein
MRPTGAGWRGMPRRKGSHMLKLTEEQRDAVLPAPFVPVRKPAPASPYFAAVPYLRKVYVYVEPTVRIDAPSPEGAPVAAPAPEPLDGFTAVLMLKGEAYDSVPLKGIRRGLLDVAIRADRALLDSGADAVAVLGPDGTVVLHTVRAAAERRFAGEALAAERSKDRAERQAARGPVCKSQNYNRSSLWAKAKQTRVVLPR